MWSSSHNRNRFQSDRLINNKQLLPALSPQQQCRQASIPPHGTVGGVCHWQADFISKHKFWHFFLISYPLTLLLDKKEFLYFLHLLHISYHRTCLVVSLPAKTRKLIKKQPQNCRSYLFSYISIKFRFARRVSPFQNKFQYSSEEVVIQAIRQ